MENEKQQITIHEALNERDIDAFWEQLHIYLKRDIIPDPEDEDRAYFLGEDYRAGIQKAHDRLDDRSHYLFFYRDGKNIGIAMPVIYNTEDEKCLIMEFCVYPEYRGNGTGRQCAGELLKWARQKGAAYAELNCGGDERRPRFWKSVGFVPNGVDQWGEPLMIYTPEEQVSYTVEVMTDPKDWQLLKLENGLMAEIGEKIMTEEQQERLQEAVKNGKITFFLAKRGYRAVGMCSVARCYSAFCGSDIGKFADLFVEPAFRSKGIAKMLVEAAQAWSSKQGFAKLTACCTPHYKNMYKVLGFKEPMEGSLVLR